MIRQNIIPAEYLSVGWKGMQTALLRPAVAWWGCAGGKLRHLSRSGPRNRALYFLIVLQLQLQLIYTAFLYVYLSHYSSSRSGLLRVLAAHGSLASPGTGYLQLNSEENPQIINPGPKCFESLLSKGGGSSEN